MTLLLDVLCHADSCCWIWEAGHWVRVGNGFEAFLMLLLSRPFSLWLLCNSLTSTLALFPFLFYSFINQIIFDAHPFNSAVPGPRCFTSPSVRITPKMQVSGCLSQLVLSKSVLAVRVRRDASISETVLTAEATQTGEVKTAHAGIWAEKTVWSTCRPPTQSCFLSIRSFSNSLSILHKNLPEETECPNVTCTFLISVSKPLSHVLRINSANR